MSQINYSLTSVIKTVTGDTGGAVSSDTLGNIDLQGVGVVSVDGTPASNLLTVSVSGEVPTQFDTDSGSATPAANILEVLGDHGITTTGSGNTVTVVLDNTLTLGDVSSVPAGSDALTITTGDISVSSGNVNLATTSSADVGVIKLNSNRFVHAYGTNNTFVGTDAGNFSLTGNHSAAYGYTALTALTSGNQNTAFGSEALDSVTSGATNIGIGYQAGSAYTTEDNNITISNTGTATDSGVIRIGTNGTHSSCYVAGIDGVNVGNVVRVVTELSDQLGTADITGGTSITVSGTANTITIDADSDIATTYNTDSGSATPSAHALTIAGGTLTTTAGSGSTVTINNDDNVVGSVSTDSGVVTPASNTLTLAGGTGIDTSGSAATATFAIADAVVNSVVTDSGTVTPTSNSFTASGGTLINTSGAGATLTVNADDNVVGTVSTDSGSATPASNTFTIAGGSNVTTSASGSTVTINASASSALSVTSINNTDSPYTVQSGDEFIAVDVSSGTVTLDLPNSATTGRVVHIKDSNGNASSNNITVTTVGGSVTIDGSTSVTMNTNYQSLSVLFDGTNYVIF